MVNKPPHKIVLPSPSLIRQTSSPSPSTTWQPLMYMHISHCAASAASSSLMTQAPSKSLPSYLSSSCLLSGSGCSFSSWASAALLLLRLLLDCDGGGRAGPPGSFGGRAHAKHLKPASSQCIEVLTAWSFLQSMMLNPSSSVCVVVEDDIAKLMHSVCVAVETCMWDKAGNVPRLGMFRRPVLHLVPPPMVDSERANVISGPMLSNVPCSALEGMPVPSAASTP
mmetsp:Transcript_88369/g.222410  ORF Transcript_88369/g.222410 Transcript_88369/m.222410 type:complete len:224 (-) Transcript_88369:1249-1920(-)